MFSPETSEIAKPSELLTSVRAYMNVLQSVENYIHVDMTRIFNNVLLQQTQQTDSNGEPTIGSKKIMPFKKNSNYHFHEMIIHYFVCETCLKKPGPVH